ncbi:hypothetical protein IIV31_101R [Armadillidium vulgare iridescent virus]|uniref:Uncharacterized protein n=1 Tax=Armadillidium vulgare iridescent virus TaxID=72201 RepID=A0A068QKV1_9VIRU|nr:hypothetical protein IIV31_101R [Armadillidium vulgare iridescent virus]CCV02473.1 hypothetical protein IIV31_101R [Armadillidium vulgare iridescent virus]
MNVKTKEFLKGLINFQVREMVSLPESVCLFLKTHVEDKNWECSGTSSEIRPLCVTLYDYLGSETETINGFIGNGFDVKDSRKNILEEFPRTAYESELFIKEMNCIVRPFVTIINVFQFFTCMGFYIILSPFAAIKFYFKYRDVKKN